MLNWPFNESGFFQADFNVRVMFITSPVNTYFILLQLCFTSPQEAL